MKGLYLWFEDNLKFDTHLKKLETELTKYARLFCKTRDFLNINTLKTLYYSLLYSELQQLFWGTANKTSLHNLSIIVNTIIRSITYNGKFCKISKVYKQQNLLKITEIDELELGQLTYKIQNGLVPTAVKEKFIASTSVHNHCTRLQKTRKLSFASCWKYHTYQNIGV